MGKNPIKFGTDGWRAIIAEDFTFENVNVCAQATAQYLKRSGLAERGVETIFVGLDDRQIESRPAPVARR